MLEKKIEANTKRLNAGERVLRQMDSTFSGGKKFREELAGFRSKYERQTNALEQLRTKESGLCTYLKATTRLVRQFEEQTNSIIEQFGGRAVKTGQFDVHNCKKHIDGLLANEFARRSQVIRIQGPSVYSESNACTGVGGDRQGDAVMFILRQLVNASENQTVVGALWPFMTTENEIWLYSHNDTKKYKCVFYRLKVDQLNSMDLLFSMNIFVPIAVCGDPGENYPMSESQVVKRKGWASTQVYSETISHTDTWNVNQTKSESFGRTIGKTLSSTLGESISQNESQTHTDSTGEGSTSSESTSWSESRSYTSGGEHSTSTSSYGSGGSMTISDTINRGSSDATSSGTTRGTSTSTSNSIQEGSQRGRSLALSEGIAEAKGQSLQFQTFHYGVDFSVGNDVLFNRWLEENEQERAEIEFVKQWFCRVRERAKSYLDRLERENEPVLEKQQQPGRFGELILLDSNFSCKSSN